MPQPRFLFLLFLAAAATLAAGVATATTWSVEATMSDERTSESTEEGISRTETFDQSYTVTYETEITPRLKLSLDVTLDVVDEIKEGPAPDSDFDTREISPSAELDLAGVWWDFTASWEQTENSTDDPGQERLVDTTWDVEYTAQPEGDTLPDVKVKVQQDRSVEGGVTTQTEKALEGTVEYTLWEILDISFDAKKDVSDDRVNVDSDTEDRDLKLDVSLSKDFNESLKLEVEWSNERQQSLTLDEDGNVLDGGREDVLDNNLRGQIRYTVLEDLELSLDREIEWQKDLQRGPLEVTDTWTGEMTYGATLTETLDLDLSYSDERQDTRGTESDSYAITRDYSVSLDFSPLENITLTPSFDRSRVLEWFDESDKPDDDTVDDSWDVEMDTNFWDDQIELTVARTFNVTTERGTKTSDERNWDVDVTLAWKRVPNLEFSPKLTFTQDDDLLKDTTDKEREWEVQLKYTIELNDTLSVSIDHTYTRINKEPGGVERSTIERDDDTDFNVTWTGFLEGMDLEFDLTRKAFDESKDDKEAEIDYTYGVTYSWIFYSDYEINAEYEYDKKDNAPDVHNLLTTFSMEILDGLLAVDFEYEFERQLEDEKQETHRYLIEFRGKF